MPRSRRLWEPGAVLSVVGRGHEGRPLFATRADRRFFADRLRLVMTRPAVDLLAWSLPVNHYHLLIRIGDVAPETLFRRLNTPVGMRERRLRGEHGAVFQGRYWSRPCTTGDECISALTYVLGNPVHHGVVPTAAALEHHEWSAYAEILGLASPGLVDAGTTLALLHPERAIARQQLRDLVAARVARWQAQRAGIDVCEEPGCRGEADGCPLVHRERTHRRDDDALLLAEPLECGGISVAHDERSVRRARLRAGGWRPDDLVGAVCAAVGTRASAVLSGSHRPADCRARAIVAYVACDGVGVPGATVARVLAVSEAAISAARRRGLRALADAGWSVDEVLSWRTPGR